MRGNLDAQMEILNIDLIKMGALCEEAIMTSVSCMLNKDIKNLDKVFSIDADIDKIEQDIEHLCMRVILQQQPVASDLRQVTAALKMISDMERIGDQASDIAEMVPYVVGNGTESETHIENMAKEVVHMTKESIDAFVNKDLRLAQKVMKDDDIVDELFLQIKRELITLVQKDNHHGEYYMDLLMIAKYLERIGDHATNIAEWVEYVITGTHQKCEG